MERLDAVESTLSESLVVLVHVVNAEVKAASNEKDEVERKRRWLAVKSMQRAEALMREALAIVAC